MLSLAVLVKKYGLIALAFLHIAVSRGLHGTFGVFFVAMVTAFGWSRAMTAGAISLAIIFEGACLPLAGALTDRIGGRKTLMLGGLVLAIGLGFASTISSIWHFYFWVGIISAFGIALIGMVPHVAILSREFPQRRGTALGIAWAGGGVGIVLLVPFAQLLIDKWGWSYAYIGVALVTALLVIPPVQLFLPRVLTISSEPTKSATTKSAVEHTETDWTVRRALTNPAFWLLFIARTLASMGNQVIVTHQVAHAVDVGLQHGLCGVDLRFDGSDQHRRQNSLRLPCRYYEQTNGVYLGSADIRCRNFRSADVARYDGAVVALHLCGLLRTRPRLARIGAFGYLGGYFSWQALRRDLRILHLQYRAGRRDRRVAWRVSFRPQS
jgi:hypothetical protein